MNLPIYHQILENVKHGSLLFTDLSGALECYKNNWPMGYTIAQAQGDGKTSLCNYKIKFHDRYMKVIKNLEIVPVTVYRELNSVYAEHAENYVRISTRLKDTLSKEFEIQNRRTQVFAEGEKSLDEKLDHYEEVLHKAEDFEKLTKEMIASYQTFLVEEASLIDSNLDIGEALRNYKSRYMTPTHPHEFLCIYTIRLKYLLDWINHYTEDIWPPDEQSEQIEPKLLNDLLYPRRASHKLIMLDDLNIIDALRKRLPNNHSNEDLGRLIAVILGITNESEIQTTIRNISYLGDSVKLSTPRARQHVARILNQFGIKPKKG